MIIPLLLALLITGSQAFAADTNAPAESNAPAAETIHPDLVLLEKDLTRAQAEKEEGKLAPERHAEWETGFRSRLTSAMERIPPSPVNQAAHARIVALLGERKKAHAALDRALESDPDNPLLLRTKGQLLLEQKDFAAAAEHGKQAYEKSGNTDKDALALYHTAKGRIASTGAGDPAAAAGSTPSNGSTAAPSDDPSKPYKLPVKGSALPSEVPALATDPAPVAPASNSPGLLTLLAVGTGVLLIAWGTVAAETKEAIKDALWEGPKQQMKVMVAATAIGAVAYGGYLVLPSMLGAGASTGAAMTPALAGGGSTGGGIALQHAVVGTAKAAILTGGAYVVGRGTLDQVNYAKSDSGGDSGAAPERKESNPSLEDSESLRGADSKEVEKLIPKDWVKGPMKKGSGTRYLNPKKPGESILIEDGWPEAADPLHRGPYVRISRNGQIIRIPLKGNPSLP